MSQIHLEFEGGVKAHMGLYTNSIYTLGQDSSGQCGIVVSPLYVTYYTGCPQQLAVTPLVV
jgi:hypothetical protein